MSKTEFLFLSEDDLVKAGVLKASECISAAYVESTCKQSVYKLAELLCIPEHPV